jgi:hypothetical protein
MLQHDLIQKLTLLSPNQYAHDDYETYQLSIPVDHSLDLMAISSDDPTLIAYHKAHSAGKWKIVETECLVIDGEMITDLASDLPALIKRLPLLMHKPFEWRVLLSVQIYEQIKVFEGVITGQLTLSHEALSEYSGALYEPFLCVPYDGYMVPLSFLRKQKLLSHFSARKIAIDKLYDHILNKTPSDYQVRKNALALWRGTYQSQLAK